eukprot:jgi/Ulvmu1/12615/UM093_0007.1
MPGAGPEPHIWYIAHHVKACIKRNFVTWHRPCTKRLCHMVPCKDVGWPQVATHRPSGFSCIWMQLKNSGHDLASKVPPGSPNMLVQNSKWVEAQHSSAS